MKADDVSAKSGAAERASTNRVTGPPGYLHPRSWFAFAVRPCRCASKPLILLVGLLCSSVILAACGGSTDPAGAPRRGGTLTITTASEPQSLDPPRGGGVGEDNADTQLFDQLFEVTAGANGKAGLAPDLVSSWELSPNGLTYTFHLRQAQFSNGAPVTSDDVVFSLKRLMDPKVSPVEAPLLREFTKSLTNPNPSTVILRLKRRTPSVLNYLALTEAAIIPKQYFLKVGPGGFAEHPVGSGAFELEHWERGNEMVLVRNPHYWRSGRPYLDKVVIRYVADANARILALRSGSTDVDDEVPYAQQSSLESQPGMKVVTSPVAATFAVVLNLHGDPLLRERDVRQALNYATPKDAIIKVVFNNQAKIANSVIPPLQHWDESVKPYPYDVAKAEELLAKSKVRHLSFTMDVLSGNESVLQTATILQQAWAKVGVDVNVHQVPSETMGQDIESGHANAEITYPTNWASDMGAEDEWGVLVSQVFPALFGYENKQLDRLIRQATTTVDEHQRQALWTAVQKLMLEEAPWVPLAYPSVTSAVRSNVIGFGMLPTVWWRPLVNVAVR
jgi:peptide/nickel transport system substrate-binding protein